MRRQIEELKLNLRMGIISQSDIKCLACLDYQPAVLLADSGDYGLGWLVTHMTLLDAIVLTALSVDHLLAKQPLFRTEAATEPFAQLSKTTLDLVVEDSAGRRLAQMPMRWLSVKMNMTRSKIPQDAFVIPVLVDLLTRYCRDGARALELYRREEVKIISIVFLDSIKPQLISWFSTRGIAR